MKTGESEAEALLCTANAITGCVQEGIGDQGIELLHWIEDRNDQIYLALHGLRSAAQTSAAWNLMAEGHPAETVADYLRRTAIGQEAWVRGRLRLAAHPFRGPFIASYWAGNESVRRVRESVSDARRPAFIAYLSVRPIAGEPGDVSLATSERILRRDGTYGEPARCLSETTSSGAKGR